MDNGYQIWSGQDEAWKDVFHSFSGDFNNWRNDFLKKYFDMEEEQYDTIETCVNTAKKEENHLAFVHYFLDKCKFENKLFAEELGKYIRRMDPDFGTNNNSMYILKGNAFLDPEVILPEEKSEIKEKFYGSNALRMWKMGESIPNNRYAIIQMGIYFRLNSETVNGLLSLAGMQKLYPVNGVDFICSVYLDYYFNEDHIKLKNRHPKRKTGLSLCNYKFEKAYPDNSEGYQRLGEVKEQVNKFLKDYIGLINERESLGVTQFVQIQTGKQKKLVLSEPLIENIEENVRLIKERLGEKEELRNGDVKGHFKTKIITEFYDKKRRQIKNREELISFLDRKEGYLDVFTIKYYELQRKLLQFVKDENAYKKNNSAVFSVSQERITKSSLSSFLQYENHNTQTQRKVEDQLKCLKKIWNDGKTATSGSFTKLEQIILGRILQVKKVDSSLSGTKSKQKYYVADITRYDLIKFCIVVGKEDELSKMLELAEFRDYKERQDEKTDAFLEYLYQYRDRLIKETIGSDTMRTKRMRESFPFISLCIQINRDLQFILEYLYGTYLAEKEYDEKVEYYDNLEKKIIPEKKKQSKALLERAKKESTLLSLEKLQEEQEKKAQEIRKYEDELKEKNKTLKELECKRRYSRKKGQLWTGMSLKEWKNLKKLLLYPINFRQ